VNGDAPRGLPRRIVGFHTEDLGDWVAVLECGHGQHVRHDPAWQNRIWVITPEGRARFVGTVLYCVRCTDAAEDPVDLGGA
jgi:hypothetical protein